MGISEKDKKKGERKKERSGLGLTDIDVENAVFSVFLKIMGDTAPMPLRRYVENREPTLLRQASYLSEKLHQVVTRDQVKGLFIRMGFGGSVYGWLEEVCTDASM